MYHIFYIVTVFMYYVMDTIVATSAVDLYNVLLST